MYGTIAFVVGEFVKEYEDANSWNLEGVFFTQKAAEKVIVNKELKNIEGNVFVGPIILDICVHPKNVIRWPNLYYPEIEGFQILGKSL